MTWSLKSSWCWIPLSFVALSLLTCGRYIVLVNRSELLLKINLVSILSEGKTCSMPHYHCPHPAIQKMLFGKKRLNQGSLVLPPNWKWCVHQPKKFLTKNPRSIGITNGKARNPIAPNSGEIRGPAIFCCQCDCCITNAFQTIEQRVQPPKATTARCHVSCGMVCVFTWQLHHN